MNKNEALNFCKIWLAAWTGNRPDLLISFYSDQAYYQDPARPNGLHGRDAIYAYFQKLLAKYPNWVWEVEEIFPQPNGFILKWKARSEFEAKESFLGLDIIDIENNKIVRNEVYFDPKFLK